MEKKRKNNKEDKELSERREIRRVSVYYIFTTMQKTENKNLVMYNKFCEK